MEITACPTENSNKIKKELRNFKAQLRSKWIMYSKHNERLVANEKSWLEQTFVFQKSIVPRVGMGRRTLEFEECSDQTKRRKTAALRSENPASALAFAAQMSFRAAGKIQEAEVIKKVSQSHNYAKDCLDLTLNSKIKKLSPREALSMIIEAQLSRKQYEIIRNIAKDLFPSYKMIQAEKSLCYPNNISVSETKAEVSLQSLLDHTANRLLNSQQNIFELCTVNPSDEIVLISKWGFDGSSSHTQYKQKFISECSDDKYMFLTSLVPLRLVLNKTNEIPVVLWQNPRPSSPRFCRPINLEYAKETNELVKEKKEKIDNEIRNLISSVVNLNACSYKVTHKPIFTMVDGKICNSLTDTNSTLRCYLCGATSKDFNNLELVSQKETQSDYLSFGISVLHSWIRTFECILHLAYKLPITSWRVSKENKFIVEENKIRIQAEFKSQMSLIVDKPKPGFGNSNDGNVARKFFQNYEASSKVTGVNPELIRRFYMILQAISSGFNINLEKFQNYCQDTARLYVELYPWMPMTPTVHKILIHGPEIINNALLPIGMLSEEAQEARNKDFKTYREYFSRKTSRKDNITDIFNRLFISSDPFMSLMRSLPVINRKSFDLEVVNLLEEER
ncbi:uncharacterized protein LOC129907699 [Episyrphus balteatus]|uniref:uncharacterized protein LOC129907699 n=1 Tax=Episyrphus balteatus TaxID=286459 RepID=UPI00248500AE|nr:uncharacterized protein LOC129907699 [Episyrphus balteatus]